ncbi:MAG: hypothetical protein IIU86_05035 [Oscillospiraceae bacterium]|nr:hypothetical protein [Oscillospiraceae bacterium]
MSEIKLISPMLDNFAIGEVFSDHNGVRSCPAMDTHTENKYIVKVVSSPASATQLDAMLLSGAFQDRSQAIAYFKEIADSIIDEANVLKNLSELEGFVPFDNHQVFEHEDGEGFDIYLLSAYKNTLARKFRKDTMTHLGAINLGLDMCAALSVSRRSGYLYVNLKPDNIFIVGDNGYRIGDLGFISLDSLKYASLPDRYRSRYTAPEIADAYASLNTTIDIYALGLVLYQAFNGGILPSFSDDAPLPPPDFADYEMAEIILKACAQNPEDRWTDPVEMGQALVTYMQRNGAHDTPIVPTVVATETATATPETTDAADAIEASAEETIPEESTGETSAQDLAAVIPEEPSSTETVAPMDTEEADIEAADDIQDDVIYAEDNLGNLSFIAEESDETLPGAAEEDLNYEQISVELSDILSQADELLAHPTPDPVVAPEPVEITIPELLPENEDPIAEVTVDEAPNEPAQAEAEQLSYDPETAGIPEINEEEIFEETPKKKHRWIPFVIIGAVVLALLAGAFYYYTNFYLQMIDSIVFDGEKTQLTVQIQTEIDQSLLTVICTDAYGNQLQAPVENGKAVFNDLSPDSAYTVKVLIKGFHRLTGNTTGAYTTPVQTTVTDFKAETGSDDGSVLLTFAADCPETTQWKITYAASGEEKKEILFSDHKLEIPGLNVGTAYDFELMPVENLIVVGETKLTHTASNVIVAENLIIKELANDKLTVVWTAPADNGEINWLVHCTNNQGFEQTVTTKESTAVFTGITATDALTVTVTAEGMSMTQNLDIPANSVSVIDFKNTSGTNDKAVLTWNTTDTTKDKKLILQYSADGSSVKEMKDLTGNTAQISPLVPGATYTISLKTDDGNTVIGGSITLTLPEPKDFDDHGIKREHIKLTMCRTPSKANWKHGSVPKSDYTTTFNVGQKASFIIYLDDDKYAPDTDNITTLYVIRDADGKIVSTATQNASWKSMWYQHYGEFDIPALPATAGTYTITIYFNGATAGVQEFTMNN